ncbi:hypothetical protein J2Z79_000982 [Symbiobacterium terraclitae]|uniref:DUF4349 domain-containing protein n=1 Tax=Symbiobacterium terraclitae TaxID=557451 RepID=A0ABS4JPX7_9FIRM|nr:DUF4349 domain-containing protein [Symbiobacterium terraclitae]MBP2017597.1 hypothetical protein [Symbiobacterium terraclitae]
MRKRTIWLMLGLILSVVLTGCGAGGSGSSEMATGGYRGSSNASAPGAAPAAQAPADGAVKSLSLSIRDTAGAPVASVTASVADRKIIQNAEVELSVRNVDDALDAINEAVRAAGGYVQENRVTGTRESGRRVNMTVRVPAGSYGSVLDLMNTLGEQIDLRQWTNDVTEEYLDLEARIQTGEAHLAQLRKLYEKSGSVTEMIELEREIARVTADLESLKGRYNYLANQVAFSTIRVNLYEPGVPTPVRDPQTLGERIRDGFLQSWHNTVALAESLLIGLVALIPVLLFLAVVGGLVGGLIWLIVRARRGRGGSGRPGGRSGNGGGTDGQAASPPYYPTYAPGGGRPADDTGSDPGK